ncbi:hypothetical protein GF366_02055 [Candidatus Peregrinibacteria bacterium]|nr:hypothetical protein [Candidatus Peregrinibacteria bacterium]
MKKIILTVISVILLTACVQQTEEKTSWNLETDNDLGKKYTGQAQLNGWIIYKDFYVEENVPHFHVSSEDISKLPPEIQDENEYFLDSEVKDHISILETYNEENPATIVVDEISIMAEGSPTMHLIEIVQ